MTAVQNGKTIINDTWNDYKADDTVHTMSVTKSIVSLLVGIAIEQGLIGSIDDYVLDYFPNYKIKRGEKTIQKVTLKNLLTMTAPYKYKSEPWSKICVQEDWSIAALDFLGGRSGITGEFQYSTLGIHILTGIIATVSKMTTVDFANKFLFEPLTITPTKNICCSRCRSTQGFYNRKDTQRENMVFRREGSRGCWIWTLFVC